MFGRIRQAVWFLLGLGIGYGVAAGPIFEWVIDLLHAGENAWIAQRLMRGSSSLLPMLFAGYLIGQGLYMIARRTLAALKQGRTRALDDSAAWDQAIRLATRFGLERYLGHCARWAEDEPANRCQSVALFQIRGLDRCNENCGTLATTRLLQDFASELRDAALPEASSRLSFWLARYAPRRVVDSGKGIPLPRLAVRWSGSTFALAFRELEAHRVIAVAQELATWMRGQLAACAQDAVSDVASDAVSLRAGVVLGCPLTSSKGILAAVEALLTDGSADQITVLSDPTDARVNHDVPIRDVDYREYPMQSVLAPGVAYEPAPNPQLKTRQWLRNWGPPVACLVSAVAVIEVTGTSGPIQQSTFPWPSTLNELQIVEPNGIKTVRLLRDVLPAKSAGYWSLSDTTLVQGNPEDGLLEPCLFHVRVTNRSTSSYYVSCHDFQAVDEAHHLISFEPRQQLRLKDGLTGRWIGPSESLDGWLRTSRRGSKCAGIEFHPDRQTYIASSKL